MDTDQLSAQLNAFQKPIICQVAGQIYANNSGTISIEQAIDDATKLVTIVYGKAI